MILSWGTFMRNSEELRGHQCIRREGGGANIGQGVGSCWDCVFFMASGGGGEAVDSELGSAHGVLNQAGILQFLTEILGAGGRSLVFVGAVPGDPVRAKVPAM